MNAQAEYAIRSTGALLVLGACLTWFGANTPMFAGILYVGVLLLVGGALITGVLIRSLFEQPVRSIRPLSPVTAMVPMRCAYCGSKVNAKALKCQSCGAPV